MPVTRIAFAGLAVLVLAGCQSEEVENIQTRAERTAAQLENRADAIQAEAENGTQSLVDAIDNQTDALANQAEALANSADNVTININ